MPLTLTVFCPDVGLVLIKLPDELLDEELELLDEELELLEDELELLEEELELDEELARPEEELDELLLELDEEDEAVGAVGSPPQPLITDASNKVAEPNTMLLGTQNFNETLI